MMGSHLYETLKDLNCDVLPTFYKSTLDPRETITQEMDNHEDQPRNTQPCHQKSWAQTIHSPDIEKHEPRPHTSLPKLARKNSLSQRRTGLNAKLGWKNKISSNAKLGSQHQRYMSPDHSQPCHRKYMSPDHSQPCHRKTWAATTHSPAKTRSKKPALPTSNWTQTQNVVQAPENKKYFTICCIRGG